MFILGKKVLSAGKLASEILKKKKMTFGNSFFSLDLFGNMGITKIEL